MNTELEELEVESKVLEYFRDSQSPLLREDELRDWWKKKQLNETSHLCPCLKRMVDASRLGTRTLSAGNSEVKVYWLRDSESTQDSPVTHSIAAAGGSGRQRVKRPHSSFVSPLIKESREKRSKLDQSSDEFSTNDGIKGKLNFSEARVSSDVSTRTSLSGPSSGEGDDQLKSLLEERSTLLTQLSSAKEELRKLRMVKMYRTKNDLQGLDQLIVKWREVAQEVAQSLLDSSTTQPRPSMQQLLDYLHIDHDLIHYSIEDESFH